MKTKLSIGTDPEFFLESETGELCSAIGKVGGSKFQPKPFGKKGFFVQEDNVAVEFNIPPAATVKEFVDSVQYALTTLTNTVKTLGLRPRLTSAEIFPSHELLDPQAHVFGCDPDFNAWLDGAKNRPPQTPNSSFRSCGGHLHFGLQKKYRSMEERNNMIHALVQAQDMFLGVPSVMMDSVQERRKLYGKAGSFRYTAYAPTAWEYRVLSNFWVKSPETMKWAFEQAQRAVHFFYYHGLRRWKEIMAKEDLGRQIEHCINSGDISLSQQLINTWDLKVA